MGDEYLTQKAQIPDRRRPTWYPFLPKSILKGLQSPERPDIRVTSECPSELTLANLFGYLPWGISGSTSLY